MVVHTLINWGSLTSIWFKRDFCFLFNPLFVQLTFVFFAIRTTRIVYHNICFGWFASCCGGGKEGNNHQNGCGSRCEPARTGGNHCWMIGSVCLAVLLPLLLDHSCRRHLPGTNLLCRNPPPKHTKFSTILTIPSFPLPHWCYFHFCWCWWWRWWWLRFVWCSQTHISIFWFQLFKRKFYIKFPPPRDNCCSFYTSVLTVRGVSLEWGKCVLFLRSCALMKLSW